MKRMRMMVWAATLLVCLTVTVPFVGADELEDEKNQKTQWDYSDLGKGEFGSVLYGPDFTRKQLEDKVVLVVFFGTRSADANALREIAQLVAQYRKGGFAAIGVKLWEKRSGKDIVSMAQDMEIRSIPIVNYAKTGAKGKKREGVRNTTGKFYCPYAVLHGRDGNVVWERRYMGAQKDVSGLIRRELEKKSGTETKKTNDFENILDGGEFPKSAVIVKLIKAGKLGVAYRRCEKYSDSEGDVGSEASELKKLLEEYHKKQLELFQKQKTTAPTDAMETLNGIAKTFRGTEFSREAQKKLNALKKDKEFRVLLKSYKECEEIMAMIEKIPDPPADDDDHKRWKRKYKSKITGLSRRIETFRKKYPDNPFIQKLQDALVPFDTEI